MYEERLARRELNATKNLYSSDLDRRVTRSDTKQNLDLDRIDFEKANPITISQKVGLFLNLEIN